MLKNLTQEDLAIAVKEWAAEFVLQPQVPMSMDLAKVFIAASLNERDETFPGPDFEEAPMYRIVSSRAKYAGLNASKAVLTVITVLATNPGIAVMYLHALALNQNSNTMDMTALSMIFPRGFLSEESLHKMWDKQKIEGNNMLDMASASVMGL